VSRLARRIEKAIQQAIEARQRVHQVQECGEVLAKAANKTRQQYEEIPWYRLLKRRSARRKLRRLQKRLRCNAREQSKAVMQAEKAEAKLRQLQRKQEQVVRRHDPPPRVPLSPRTENWLFHPTVFHRAYQLVDKRWLIPDSRGIYAWFFAPGSVPVPEAQYVSVGGFDLLYAGVAGRHPNRLGSLRDRIYGMHLNGYAHSSTLRYSLGVLLQDKLDLHLVEREASSFVWSNEDALTGWICDNACVSWLEDNEPREIETQVLRSFGAVLPLNIEHNPDNAFAERLSEYRRRALAQAEKQRQ
jgi:hypothetical protein